MGKLFNIIFSLVFLAAFILTTVGFSLPSWAEGQFIRAGLFEYCIKVIDEWHCDSLDSDAWDSEHKAVVAMMSVGLLFNVGASIAYGMSVFSDKDLKAANGASMAGGVSQLIAVIIYGVYIDDNYPLLDAPDNLGPAFWLTCVGSIGLIANSIVASILDFILCC